MPPPPPPPPPPRAVAPRCQQAVASLQDPDLRELRDTREWIDMLSSAKGGMSRGTKINLRTEAKVGCT